MSRPLPTASFGDCSARNESEPAPLAQGNYAKKTTAARLAARRRKLSKRSRKNEEA
ncbi:MAG: hypothetical protein KF835_10360 [Xanthobacteraceae bacterium]|nr:hypothetical protein [Xanthobacteraceae bacterium]